ncbi:MAG: D,D-heptose 1,7-bisphosphate phosphatase [Holophagaceae bacterium]|nr:D,D-heptose 1,7-bisphosphate phosphatase [Holophagaceae bacterium]
MKAAIFLDRDGTLNEEVDYLHRVEEVALVPGAAQAIAALNARGIPVIVITNQSGIGRGYFSWEEYQAVMNRIDVLLAREGAHIDGAYASPHHEKGQGIYQHPDHPDRKPNPGMLLRAAEEHRIDLSRSWMVGDKEIDVEAGHRAGCRSALVRTGYGSAGGSTRADLVAKDLPEAIQRILSGE